MLNNVTYQGRLVRDVELKETNGGVPYAKFTVAWSEKYKETETVCFLDCTAFRGTAEFVNKYWGNGQEIIVEGKLVTNKWTDKEGNNRSRTELTVNKAHFCGAKQSGTGSSEYRTASNGGIDVGFTDDDEDDGELPF